MPEATAPDVNLLKLTFLRDIVRAAPDPQAESFPLMELAQSIINSVAEREFTPEALEAPLRDLAEELGLKPGQLFGILRMAVTGQAVSPPLFETMVVLGRAATLERVQLAVQRLGGLDT